MNNVKPFFADNLYFLWYMINCLSKISQILHKPFVLMMLPPLHCQYSADLPIFRLIFYKYCKFTYIIIHFFHITKDIPTRLFPFFPGILTHFFYRTSLNFRKTSFQRFAKPSFFMLYLLKWHVEMWMIRIYFIICPTEQRKERVHWNTRTMRSWPQTELRS